MTDLEIEPRPRRAPVLWILALAVVVADAAVWFVGVSHGLVGMATAVAVIIWTQRRADAYWRAHHAAAHDSTA